MNVPTRWSASTPSAHSAFASRAARSPTSAKLRRRAGTSSPAQVTTSLSPNVVQPYRRIAPTVSGMSIIVLITTHLTFS
jgi:hypothetical protein